MTKDEGADRAPGKTARRRIWKTDEDVFGTWLGYSEECDTLVQGGSRYRDRASDEVGEGLVAHRGADGDLLWRNRELAYEGPPILHHDRIITNGDSGRAIDLLTGKDTGWTWRRMYGCNTAVAGERLMTFRSGAAGYCDLAGDSGTGNIGGFRSGYTSNLIVANGVLNAPEYTRTCTCAYQNQSSLALIHAPEEEMWTFGGAQTPGALGVNFGAPGNRRAPNGTLWLDFPNVGGDAKPVDMSMAPENPEVFRYHASRITEGDLKWVAASGVRGLTSATLVLGEADRFRGECTVRLVFAEVEKVGPGARVFDVALQGGKVLESFDIVQAAGGRNRSVIREFSRIGIDRTLTINLTPRSGDTAETLLCGIEVLSDR